MVLFEQIVSADVVCRLFKYCIWTFAQNMQNYVNWKKIICNCDIIGVPWFNLNNSFNNGLPIRTFSFATKFCIPKLIPVWQRSYSVQIQLCFYSILNPQILEVFHLLHASYKMLLLILYEFNQFCINFERIYLTVNNWKQVLVPNFADGQCTV